MNLLPGRSLYAVAAVVDVALHARPAPASAKALAGRLGVGPRHLESVLQALVRSGILRGRRGPRGGYELARERRRISIGDIVRSVERPGPGEAASPSDLIGATIAPAVAEATAAFLAALDGISVDALCRSAGPAGPAAPGGDFTI